MTQSTQITTEISQYMKTHLIKTILLNIIFFLSFNGNAEIRLASIFSDHMVLQQQTEVAIWGWGDDRETISVTPSWNQKTYISKVEKSGNWKLKIPTPSHGGPYEILVKGSESEIMLTDILIGEVWLCAGQSNMEMPMKGFRGEPVLHSNQDIITSANKNIRFISVPRKSTTIPQNDFEGTWETASPATVANFSATAYYFARLLSTVLNDVPIGLVEVSYGGSNAEAWMSKETLTSYNDLYVPHNDEEIDERNRTPTALYNGMLYPVIGFTIRGCIWYQGESNAHAPDQYEKLFPDMVSQWRRDWGQGEFPFYYAQIAPFNYDTFYDAENLPWYANSAYLRDAQRKAQYKIPNAGMTSLLDAGDMKTIHPVDKKTPGERLAYLALAKTYKLEGFGYGTPDYDQLNVTDSLVTITFKNLPNGLTSFNEEVTAFTVAGDDQVFYPAKCIVRRKSVQVYSEQVKNPKAVRYAFTNEGPAQLFSNEGLPLTSFRTDNWNPEEIIIPE